jgi:predicted ferric reductase
MSPESNRLSIGWSHSCISSVFGHQYYPNFDQHELSMAMVFPRHKMWLVSYHSTLCANSDRSMAHYCRMAVINMSFTFFLALKNTPLSFLAGSSYEKLNILHRWTGRTTFIFLILHVALVQFISMSCQATKLSLPLNFLFLRLAAFKYYLGCFSTWLAVQAFVLL